MKRLTNTRWGDYYYNSIQEFVYVNFSVDEFYINKVLFGKYYATWPIKHTLFNSLRNNVRL